MKLDWSHWGYTLGKSVIGGIASSLIAWLTSIAGHNIAPAYVDKLDFSQLCSVVIGSAILHVAFYLAKSPLPQDLENTEPIPVKSDEIKKDP